MHESYQPVTGLLSEFIILTDFKMHGVSSCHIKQYYTKSGHLIVLGINLAFLENLIKLCYLTH
jgi:hypothetical protein